MKAIENLVSEGAHWLASLDLNKNTIVEGLMVAAIVGLVGGVGTVFHFLWQRRLSAKRVREAPTPAIPKIRLWETDFAPETEVPKNWIIVVPKNSTTIFCPLILHLINTGDQPMERPILVVRGPRGIFGTDDLPSTITFHPGALLRYANRVVQPDDKLMELSMELPTIAPHSGTEVRDLLIVHPTIDRPREISVPSADGSLLTIQLAFSYSLRCWISFYTGSGKSARGDFAIYVVPADSIEEAITRLSKKPKGEEGDGKSIYDSCGRRVAVLQLPVKQSVVIEGKTVVELEYVVGAAKGIESTAPQ